MSNKVPIERVHREKCEVQTRGVRIARACAMCRQRKMRCDGNRPMCAQCNAQDLATCVYSEPNAAFERRQQKSTGQKLEIYEKLLRDISSAVDTSIAKQIANTLKSVPSSSPKRSERQTSFSGASSSPSTSPLDEIDTVEEDPTRSGHSRAMGHMGKSFEAAHMQRVGSEATQNSGNWMFLEELLLPLRCSVDDSSASMGYHLNHESISDQEVANIFVLPPKALSDKLVLAYFEKVHSSLAIVRHDLFMKQYERVFSEAPINPGRKWLAILNMVLAIGSRFCQVSHESGEFGEFEIVFFSRAKSLSSSEDTICDHHDLQQVQTEALRAFYFLASLQIDRSWNSIGIAARSGIALGLNLRTTNNNRVPHSNEARRQLWWSIFYLENLLSVMTGRVSCLCDSACDSACAVPPLLPLEMFG